MLVSSWRRKEKTRAEVPKTAPFDAYYERYEEWFERNHLVYRSEVEALRALVPPDGLGVEVGVGSGRFAVPLGVRLGVEPSVKMAAIARARGIDVVSGTGEILPLKSEFFDYVLMVTTICFLDDISASFREVFRILKPQGKFIIGFIDAASKLGREYERNKEKSVFYRFAAFFSVDEVVSIAREAGFEIESCAQTLFAGSLGIEDVEPVREGHGEGAFVGLRAVKRPKHTT